MKRYFLFFILFALTTKSQMTTTLIDEFNYKDVYWSNSTWDDVTYYRNIEDGVYNMEHRNNAGKYITYKKIYLEQDNPFSLETDLTFLEYEDNATVSFVLKDTVGPIFLFNINPSRSNANIGLIEAPNDYRILKNIDKQLGKKTVKFKNLGKPNRVKIEWSINTLSLFINNELASKIDLENFKENIPKLSYLGIQSHRNSKFQIDNIRIQQSLNEMLSNNNNSIVFSKVKLPGSVNSDFSERTPVISHDGKELYFIRQNHTENNSKNVDNIWFSKVQNDSVYSTAIEMEKPLNNDSHNSVISVTADNNHLLLLGVYDKNGRFKKNGISKAKRNNYGWDIPKEVIIEDYYNHSKYMEATMSIDGGVIILAVERKDSHGSNDLYFSFRNKDNTYTKPKNLGESINSKGWEITPFLSADNKTLYFSSNGHNGFGDYDVFKSVRLDNSWENWSTPVNLGANVNTTGYDAYFSISANGNQAYMVADYSGNMDIYKLNIPKESKPNANVIVNGKVINGKTNEPIMADIIVKNLVSDTTLFEYSSLSKDGKYTFILPSGFEYSFSANHSEYYPVSENIDLTNLISSKSVEKNLVLFPIEKGIIVKINNVFFNFNEAKLKPESYFEINKLIGLMNKNKSIIIELRGHTDSKGDDDFNLKLSEKRVEEIKKYMIQKKIDSNRIVTKGLGESNPLSTNSTDEGRAMNRRVEFKILEN